MTDRPCLTQKRHGCRNAAPWSRWRGGFRGRRGWRAGLPICGSRDIAQGIIISPMGTAVLQREIGDLEGAQSGHQSSPGDEGKVLVVSVVSISRPSGLTWMMKPLGRPEGAWNKHLYQCQHTKAQTQQGQLSLTRTGPVRGSGVRPGAAWRSRMPSTSGMLAVLQPMSARKLTRPTIVLNSRTLR